MEYAYSMVQHPDSLLIQLPSTCMHVKLAYPGFNTVLLYENSILDFLTDPVRYPEF